MIPLRISYILLIFWLYCCAGFSSAETRNSCFNGDGPKGSIVAVNGAVTIKPFGGNSFVASVGDPLCASDQIETGPLSRVEFRLAGQNTTTGSSSNSILTIPGENESCVTLNSGVFSFISSVFRSQCFDTPLIDAAIEGTEALIVVDDTTGDSFVMVREGIVRVRDRRELNSTGAGGLILRSSRSEEASAAFATVQQPLRPATLGSVPEQFRGLLLRPERATDWAIYYPPILLGHGARNKTIIRASTLLNAGDAEQAAALLRMSALQGDNRAVGFALRAIAALFRDDIAIAEMLSAEAVSLASGLSPPHIAESYVRQALGDLPSAITAAEKAVAASPEDPFAWARLAELELTNGNVHDATQAVRESLGRQETSLGRAIEGFSALAANNFEDSIQSFQRAIELDSTSPLPRLGLGLNMIRNGSIDKGRLEIEAAVALDPRRAVLRTWLGRAYLEEARPEKAGTQFNFAQRLDADNPNAFLFDAIRLFSANRPVDALTSLRAAQSAGPGRSTVRSLQGLAEDQAVRGSAVGRVYDVLGFKRLYQITSAAAVDVDTTNPEAHRTLSEAARTDPDSEIAQVSERLISALLEPPSLTPIQPQLGEIDLALQETSGSTRISFSEFAPLFRTNGLRGDVAVLGGTQGTRGYEVSATGLQDNTSIGLGAFEYNTDGFTNNNDLRNLIYTAQIRHQPTAEVVLVAEASRLRTESGDRFLGRSPENMPSPNLRNSVANDQFRIGASNFLASNIHMTGYAELARRKTAFSDNDTDKQINGSVDEDALKAEVALHFSGQLVDTYGGIEYSHSNINSSVLGFDEVPFDINNNGDREFWKLYAYFDFEYPNNFLWSVGGAFESYKENSQRAPINRKKLSPRIGFRYQLSERVALRAIYSRSIVRSQIFPETLERTQIGGFDQFFDDAPGNSSKILGAGIDLEPSNDLFVGLDARSIRQVSPNRGSGSSRPKELSFRGYVSTTLSDRVSISMEPEYSRFSDGSFSQIDSLKTLRIPLNIGYFHPSGGFLNGTLNYFHQTGSDGDSEIHNRGLLLDLAAGYRFSSGNFVLAIEGRNLFNNDTGFIQQNPIVLPDTMEDLILLSPTFSSERTIIASLKMRF